MPAHTEIELKWALDALAHQRLAERLSALLGPPRLLAQDNRFFDTASRALRSRGMNVRVRREASPAETRIYVTCKRRLDFGAAGAHQHEEWEQDIEGGLWSAVERGDATQLPLSPAVASALGAERLEALGGFANARCEHHDGAELLCLDRTDFVTRVDHELEIETPDPARAAHAWTRRLAEWSISWREQRLTKFARFLAIAGG